MEDQYTLGEIRLIAGASIPKGWLVCDGRKMSVPQNQALYSLLGTTYGGDGVKFFCLPDFQGRTPIHPTSIFKLGLKDGENANTLQPAQLPAHPHPVEKQKVRCRASATGGVRSANPRNNYPTNSNNDFSYASTNATAGLAQDAVVLTSSSVGASKPMENMMPSLCLNFIICINGLYPAHE